MSLYSTPEICGGCKHATWFDCGNCLKVCAIGHEDQRSGVDGSCPGYALDGECPRCQGDPIDAPCRKCGKVPTGAKGDR